MRLSWNHLILEMIIDPTCFGGIVRVGRDKLALLDVRAEKLVGLGLLGVLLFRCTPNPFGTEVDHIQSEVNLQFCRRRQLATRLRVIHTWLVMNWLAAFRVVTYIQDARHTHTSKPPTPKAPYADQRSALS